MGGKRQAGWPSLLVTYLLATQEISNSGREADRNAFAVALESSQEHRAQVRSYKAASKRFRCCRANPGKEDQDSVDPCESHDDEKTRPTLSSQWQAQPNLQPATLGVAHLDAAAMHLHHALHDRQPQTMAIGPRRIAAAVERPEKQGKFAP